MNCNDEYIQDACCQNFLGQLHLIPHHKTLYLFTICFQTPCVWHVDCASGCGLWYSYVCHKIASGPFKLPSYIYCGKAILSLSRQGQSTAEVCALKKDITLFVPSLFNSAIGPLHYILQNIVSFRRGIPITLLTECLSQTWVSCCKWFSQDQGQRKIRNIPGLNTRALYKTPDSALRLSTISWHCGPTDLP
jgi:hypothetical protein